MLYEYVVNGEELPVSFMRRIVKLLFMVAIFFFTTFGFHEILIVNSFIHYD